MPQTPKQLIEIQIAAFKGTHFEALVHALELGLGAIEECEKWRTQFQPMIPYYREAVETEILPTPVREQPTYVFQPRCSICGKLLPAESTHPTCEGCVDIDPFS